MAVRDGDILELPERKPNRLKTYNYSKNGAYFVTVCVQNRLHILSRILVGDGFPVPKPTDCGNIVLRHIDSITDKYPSVRIDKYVVMPNHIHMIIMIDAAEHGTGNPSPTVSTIMGWFKYQTTKGINDITNATGCRVWQRSFYDRIIRDEQEYRQVWQYIDANPINWQTDEFYPR